MTITQEELKRLLHYDPDTGVFTWLKRNGRTGGVNCGDVAGYKHKGIKNKYYIKIRVNSISYYAHRLVWVYLYNKIPLEIDHIDGNGLNNRIINLREVSRVDNCKNIKKASNNTSGVTGVTFDHRYNKWHAKIQINYKNKSLGYFNQLHDAACTRRNAEIKYGFHENHGMDKPL